MRKEFLLLMVLSCLAVKPAHLAFADATTEAQLRAALQQLTTQIANLENQVANLQAAQAPNVAMINALQAQLQTAKQGAPKAGAPSAEQQAAQDKQLAALHRQLAAQNAALGRTQTAYAQAAASANDRAAANTQLNAQITALNGQLNSCNTKNAQLFKTGNLILDQLAHRDDFFGSLASREPFIGVQRVNLQNIVQDDQNKLLDNQINQGQTSP